jgi:uncharacterized protein (TIGR02453 family)
MPFTGFPKECVEFYRALKKNNSKTWFDNHKDDYDYYVMNPARDFVVDMGKALQKISPGIHADPRVNKSLFRIYRDTRFSNDKTPFKTNLGIWFWEGDGKRFDYSGFYFHLEPPNIMLAAGKHKFEPGYMKAFRDSVVHEIHGPKLIKAIKQVEKAGYQVGSKQYKKTPRGYDKDHPYADYLLFDGMYGFHETKIPTQFYSDDLIEYSYKIFKALAPVHKWLVEMIGRTEIV